MAAQEDDWEFFVEQQLEEEGLSLDDWEEKQPGLDWGAYTWEDDMSAVDAELVKVLNQEQLRVVALSQRQLRLVEEERELWRKERAERRHEKKLAKIAKKEAEGNKGTATSKTDAV